MFNDKRLYAKRLSAIIRAGVRGLTLLCPVKSVYTDLESPDRKRANVLEGI